MGPSYVVCKTGTFKFINYWPAVSSLEHPKYAQVTSQHSWIEGFIVCPKYLVGTYPVLLDCLKIALVGVPLCVPIHGCYLQSCQGTYFWYAVADAARGNFKINFRLQKTLPWPWNSPPLFPHCLHHYLHCLKILLNTLHAYMIPIVP